MRYNLGTFEPRPDSRGFQDLQASFEFGESMPRALKEMLGWQIRRATTGPFPDLLEALPSKHPDRTWVETVHSRMQELRQTGLPLHLLACELEQGDHGYLTIVATAPSVRLEVLEDDWMQVGFAAMREAQGVVRTWPRLMREACDNGSILCVENLERHEGVAGLGEAIGRFLAPELYEPAVRALREAEATRVVHTRAIFEAYRRALHGMGESSQGRLRLSFNSLLDEGAHSQYEIMNVITAAARELDDWRERLDLEELGGQLALLRPPVPRRSRGATLVPA